MLIAVNGPSTRGIWEWQWAALVARKVVGLIPASDIELF